MGFIYLAKHGLNKHGLKTKLVSNWGREKRREREGREKGEKKRKRKREEEKRKKNERSSSNQKGMELHGILKFCMNFDALMVISLFPKPRVLLGFLPNPRILKSNLGKTLNRTRST